MSSPLTICNSALLKLGGRNITSLTQNVKEARLCNERYPVLRDEVLSSHPWNFAMSRAQLAQLVSTPAFGWTHEYSLPSDCLRVIDIDTPSAKWIVEGKKLLTNLEEVSIRYIKQETNAGYFSPKFVEALSMRLAWDMAYPLVQSGTLQAQWEQTYKDFMRETRSIDAQEGTPEELIDEHNDVFLNARF